MLNGWSRDGSGASSVPVMEQWGEISGQKILESVAKQGEKFLMKVVAYLRLQKKEPAV